MLAPLQLEDYSLEELSFKRGRSLKPGESFPAKLDYQFAVDYDVDSMEAPRETSKFSIRLRLSVESEDADAPCPIRSLSAEVLGVFSLPGDAPDAVLSSLVPANCLSILYGLVRAQVIQMTSAHPEGGFILPTLNVRAIVEQKDAGQPAKGQVRAIQAPSGPAGKSKRKKLPKRKKPAPERKAKQRQ